MCETLRKHFLCILFNLHPSLNHTIQLFIESKKLIYQKKLKHSVLDNFFFMTVQGNS